MLVLGVLLFSRRLGRHLEERLFPLGRRIRLERPLRSLYAALHEYRYAPRVLLAVLGATVVAQFLRVIAIWLCGEAVGIDVSPAVYVILGPLLFLVQMVPFTLNGLGVREAFFVVFLGRFGVEADAAFATGFLYYAVSIATSLPGGFILLWRSVRPARARPAA
jgi:glycosyltransferase 2 family protein